MTAAARQRADVVSLLLDIGVIPVVRAPSSEIAIRVAETLVEAGLPIIEVTMTVPGAIDVIAALTRRFGGKAVIGAGTVIDERTVEGAIDAGAEFIVSPGMVGDVIDAAHRHDVALIPGALTPTEIITAQRAGADMVKIFPAQSVGGASYIRALLGPFPDIPFVPTGGVTLLNVGDFIRAGSAAVGVGGDMISREAIGRGDYQMIGALATQFVAAVKAARHK
jgi:2-dehydro-3-deoxyphosphogluconate aldolase/(4S)-4-hydroxy-2-oxoglutarate aldolase